MHTIAPDFKENYEILCAPALAADVDKAAVEGKILITCYTNECL